MSSDEIDRLVTGVEKIIQRLEQLEQSTGVGEYVLPEMPVQGGVPGYRRNVAPATKEPAPKEPPASDKESETESEK